MKKNLVKPKKQGGTVGSFVRLPIALKEEAQIWCIKNKKTLTDIIIEGVEKAIRE
jgi:hypothetical protein|tara:strand:- start:8027 stop:8191 length:165 start_codon:yes stop_codon:yes gene_type:complete